MMIVPACDVASHRWDMVQGGLAAMILLEKAREGIRPISRYLRRWIAARFPNRLPKLYSTLDHPQEVPVQVAAYRLASEELVFPGSLVLDIGCGLGYGLDILLEGGAERVLGIDVDQAVIDRVAHRSNANSRLAVEHYDGRAIPFGNREFDVVTCVDVIEHVRDYQSFLGEVIRVSRGVALLSTPLRRPEFTKKDGTPRNIWHLREWSFEEFYEIVTNATRNPVRWRFLDGDWEGPFVVSSELGAGTMAIVAVVDCSAHSPAVRTA